MKTPYYIVYEEKLRRNLNIILRVSREANVKIIMAFKANALWRTFPIFREYGICSTASSVNEMLLANDELECLAHTYCPAYTDETIEQFMQGSSHITFNSVEQFRRFADRIAAHNAEEGTHRISCGLRINPMCSVIETDIYNPCGKHSRLGVTEVEFKPELLDGIEGLHFHALCEQDADALEGVLAAFEQHFGKYLPQMKWVNF
ncbi:MAG: carboxynorspermidine decarboxylase, partial [Muribaculaceae bacterium]|nr:carboxynorspermidine decarboxylase [Muribaculaceae bacterium]